MGRLVEAGGGAIVNITSVAGERAWPEDVAYNASKAGVEMLTRTIPSNTRPAGCARMVRLANVAAARESELLGLWWQDLDLTDLDAATTAFTHQVDRHGVRVLLKTEESRAMLPLPRSAAVMVLEPKARSLHTGPRSCDFATASGRPLGQRNVLRALYTAQERARDEDGRPSFPELFEHDDRGHLVVDERGEYVPNRQVRRGAGRPSA